MSGKEGVTLGPFSGGLNTLADLASIDDTELVDVVNFEFDTDGSLTSRYPLTKLGVPTGLSGTDLRLLGYFVTVANVRYIIAATTTGTYSSLDGVTWTAITTAFSASGGVQFAGFYWLLAPVGSAGASGKWNPTTAFATVSNMPQGENIVVYKNRMFVVPGKAASTNGSRLTFSDFVASDASITWTASNFIDINPGGDGQNLIDLIVDTNNIVLFKADSTYVYTYSSLPASGTISLVSNFVGVSDTRCVVQTSMGIFTLHKGILYSLVSLNYESMSEKVPFGYTPGTYATYNTIAALGYFEDRLIVRHFDRMYVYYLKTGTWSRWESTFVPAYIRTAPRLTVTTQLNYGYATSCIKGVNEIYRIQNTYDSTTTEQMTCSFRTKIYDYKSPSTWKRIHWWGVDVIAKNAVNVVEYPVIYRQPILWEQLEQYTWDSFSNWDNLIYSDPSVADSANAGDAPQRKFIKFIKSLRFRQIYFTVSVDTDGSVSGSLLNGLRVEPYPCKVFSITTVVTNKELVAGKVN